MEQVQQDHKEFKVLQVLQEDHKVLQVRKVLQVKQVLVPMNYGYPLEIQEVQKIL